MDISLPMIEPLDLLVRGIFSAVGVGFFVYGKKQKSIVPKYAGLLLLTAPYLLPIYWMQLTAGVLLILVAVFVRI